MSVLESIQTPDAEVVQVRDFLIMEAASLAGNNERARRAAFFDTDLLTCTIWDDLLFPGECPLWVRKEADDRARAASLFLLCDTDVPFAPDPQRCFPDEAGRARGRLVWREALEKRGLPFVEIRGDWPGREAAAFAAVEARLK